MKQKLPLIIGAIVILVLVIGGGVFLATRGGKPTEDAKVAEKKRKSAPVNTISVAERPYLQIVPEVDGHNITFKVLSVPKTASTVEYEIEYQAGSLLQGAFGELTLGTLPASKTILLGSCSAGGACTFHEDVRGGSITTRYDAAEAYALKSDWKYIDNKAKEAAFSSKDAKFQIESDGLKTVRYLVIFNTAGYPAGLSGTPVSDPYSLTSSSSLNGQVKLTMRANEEGSLKIQGWDGQKWQSFETAVDGKTATATVPLMELYVVTK